MVVYLSELIAPSAVEELKKHATIVDNFDHPEEIDAMIIRKQPVTREVIEKATKLKVISRHGVGCDMIDLEACKEYGVKVIIQAGGNAQSVAELAVSFMLALARKLKLADQGLQKGRFNVFAPKETIGMDTFGKTVALVGSGHISSKVAAIMKNGFGCRILAYSPHLTPEKAAAMGAEYCPDLDEMLKEADYINISVPLTDSTRHMFNKERLSLLKPTAILVNTSRGGIVDEDALYEILRDGKIWGAASDVFTIEPPEKDNPLLSLDNFIATPHFGSSTYECMEECGMVAVKNVFANV
ncbi:MAG: hydroxyacid dehydrogenase [Lachnospiraceae bacterium]|nr:hydroxyacid dehydrogenase [Lachnospiraceae bacterium]